MAEPRCWLFKSEPSSYSYDDLESEDDQTAEWDGVRNYQARNFIRDDMAVGDQVLFYHSNAKPPGVVGIARIVREGYPDTTAWDPNSRYYDPKSDPANPTWMMVDIKADRRLPRFISLNELKANPSLVDMMVTKRGQRLSVQPVKPEEWAEVITMAERPED
jgi:predicted RNA-binding protein with PUA-like domain